MAVTRVRSPELLMSIVNFSSIDRLRMEPIADAVLADEHRIRHVRRLAEPDLANCPPFGGQTTRSGVSTMSDLLHRFKRAFVKVNKLSVGAVYSATWF